MAKKPTYAEIEKTLKEKSLEADRLADSLSKMSDELTRLQGTITGRLADENYLRQRLSMAENELFEAKRKLYGYAHEHEVKGHSEIGVIRSLIPGARIDSHGRLV